MIIPKQTQLLRTLIEVGHREYEHEVFDRLIKSLEEFRDKSENDMENRYINGKIVINVQVLRSEK